MGEHFHPSLFLCPSIPWLSVQAAVIQAWASRCTPVHTLPLSNTGSASQASSCGRGQRKVGDLPARPRRGPGEAGEERRPYVFHLPPVKMRVSTTMEWHREDEDEGRPGRLRWT